MRSQSEQIRSDLPVLRCQEGDAAILQSVTLNGQPASIEEFKMHRTNSIQLPHKLSWKNDKVELVWSFSLPAMQDYAAFRAPLRSLMPVHAYSLTLHLEDDSGFMGMENTCKFNKRPKELENETEARRTLKCFTGGGDAPRDDFGTCGLPIVPRSASTVR